MNITDIFNNRSPKKLNEAIETVFGKKLNLEAFTIEQLEDSRNRLRTQIYTVRNSSGFNETVENDSYTKAQWMLDAINAEVMQRESAELEEAKKEEEDDFDALKHVKDPTPGEKKAAKDVKRGSYADRAAMLKSAEADGRLKEEDDVEESNINNGEDMTQVRESATDKASAVVTAKTMVDRVGRWIEELAGMENDTLLSLGDTIRDEMGQDQAKAFLSNVAPAIQQALQNLKATRETLATGVRGLTGEEQSAELIGSEAPDMGGDMAADAGDEIAPVAPDEMNTGEEEAMPADEFAASEPAVGGMETAGRAQRESIDRSSQLLRVLAG